jgi:hypothetical protein
MKTFELMGSYQSISDADGNILIEYELDDVIAAVTENIKVLLR